MKVSEMMRKTTVSCRPDSSLATAAALMWDHDTGVLPVIGASGAVVGMITDRDICIGCGTRDRPAAAIAVAEVMTPNVASCAPDDEVGVALELMRARKVRRLPVVDREGHLHGVLSMTDVPFFAGEGPAISFEEVVSLFQSLAENRRSRQRPVH